MQNLIIIMLGYLKVELDKEMTLRNLDLSKQGYYPSIGSSSTIHTQSW